MADLDSIQQRLDALIEGRYEDKEEVIRELHAIKIEIGQVRVDVAQAMGTLIEKIDKNYVRKDVNDEKDKAHDSKILELSTGLSGAKTEHVVLKNRIDRFAVAGASIATVLAMFKNDLADLIKHILP